MASSQSEYNDIIKSELKRHKRPGFGGRAEEGGNSARDQAVRTANVRTGHGNSTADRSRPVKSKSRDDGSKKSPGSRKRSPGGGNPRLPDKAPIPTERPDPTETGPGQSALDYLLMAALGGTTGYAYNRMRKPGRGPMPAPDAPDVEGGPTRANINEFGQDFGPVDQPPSPAPVDPNRFGPQPAGPATTTMPDAGGGDGWADSIAKTLGISPDELRRLAKGVT